MMGSFDGIRMKIRVSLNSLHVAAGNCLLMLLLVAAEAFGVVIDVGDGTGNTTAPVDDPGFANVAIRGDASAIYLGNRWMLTAVHVGPGSVVLNGEQYDAVAGESFRLSNLDDSLTSATDLLLFRLSEDPGLPNLRLPCSPVSIGSTVTLVGQGYDREVDETFWDVEVRSGDNNDIWTERGSEAGSDRQGYQTTDSQSVRWGDSLITLTNFDTNANWGDVLSFQTSFDRSLEVENLGQGVRGDSGGAVFQKNSGLWELVGMIHAVSLLDGQPGGTRTAVFGNETYVADLYRYADQIREIADFEPIAGDFDANGTVEAADIDALLDVIRQPTFASCHFDLVGNNGLDEDDLTEVISLAGGLLGDANLDGVVGFRDFLTVSRSFNKTGTTWSDGDFDGDDSVTFADFLLLSRNFGNAIELSATSVQSVPEPRFLVWLVVSAVLLLRRLERTRVGRESGS